ncbi:hypothetical protein [Microbacterium pumilum]
MSSSNSSPMMGGGRMELVLGPDGGKEVGSHVIMRGRAFGFDLYLEEVVIERIPGEGKTWQTLDVKLIVIGAYQFGFHIEPQASGSRLTVRIDYGPPHPRSLLGLLFGPTYARWCVQQMTRSAVGRFGSASPRAQQA